MKISLKQQKTDGHVKFYTAKQWKTMPETKCIGSAKFFTLLVATYVKTPKKVTSDDTRLLAFKLIGYLNSLTDETFTITPPTNHVGAFIEGLILGNYNYQYYKSEPSDESTTKIVLNVPVDGSMQYILRAANARANAQNLVRDLVNGTAEDMTSVSIENAIQSLFRGHDNITVESYNTDELRELNMNGHLAVNRASVNPPITVKITYTPTMRPYKKEIVLVGKGLTYDSGGLSIKPTNSMINMKCDKAGAMTVIGIMQGLRDLGSDHRVTAYIALAENMIDGNAYRPGDVLTMKNGKTVHIKNTDAEGRIVLFDNLCLAEEQIPNFDEIYTFATLTGAAVTSFGNEASGMVGFNDKMKKQIKKIGLEEGEIFINAEFHKFMMNGVDDKLADLSNTGTANQGCQKAGLFLTNALTKAGKKRYMHVDMAGPAFAKTAFGSNKAGGTGYGVRTFINYLTK